MRPPKGVRLALTLGVLLPYLASLALPAVTGDIDAPDTTAPGVQALLMGFIFNPLAWLANVMLPIALVRFHAGRLKQAAGAGAAAVICAAIPLVWSQGLERQIGYYVWLSSMVVFLGGLLLFGRLGRGVTR